MNESDIDLLTTIIECATDVRDRVTEQQRSQPWTHDHAEP